MVWCVQNVLIFVISKWRWHDIAAYFFVTEKHWRGLTKNLFSVILLLLSVSANVLSAISVLLIEIAGYLVFVYCNCFKKI